MSTSNVAHCFAQHAITLIEAAIGGGKKKIARKMAYRRSAGHRQPAAYFPVAVGSRRRIETNHPMHPLWPSPLFELPGFWLPPYTVVLFAVQHSLFSANIPTSSTASTGYHHTQWKVPRVLDFINKYMCVVRYFLGRTKGNCNPHPLIYNSTIYPNLKGAP